MKLYIRSAKVFFSGSNPEAHVPTTMQMPSGRFPQRCCREMGLWFPMQSRTSRPVMASSVPATSTAAPLGAMRTPDEGVLSRTTPPAAKKRCLARSRSVPGETPRWRMSRV